MTTHESNAAEVIVGTLQSDRMNKIICGALPPWMPPERFMAAAISAFRTTDPEVWEDCDRASIYNSVAHAARDGLLIDGRHGAIVPFRTKQKGGGWKKKAQFLIMPKGIIDAFARVRITAYAASVYENDGIRFWNDDKGQHVAHDYNPLKDRGAYLGAYACAVGPDQSIWVEAMGLEELKKVQDSSPAPNSPAWTNWPERMDQKSCLHRLAKRVPSVDLTDDMDPGQEPETKIEVAPRTTQVDHAALLEGGTKRDG